MLEIHTIHFIQCFANFTYSLRQGLLLFLVLLPIPAIAYMAYITNASLWCLILMQATERQKTGFLNVLCRQFVAVFVLFQPPCLARLGLPDDRQKEDMSSLLDSCPPSDNLLKCPAFVIFCFVGIKTNTFLKIVLTC